MNMPNGFGKAHKNYRQLREVKSRKWVFLREENNWVSSAKRLALETYMQVTLYGFNRLYLGLYMYIEIHIYMK